MIPSFTIILGVDSKHLEQLRVVWPTWVKHKPSMIGHEQDNVVIFYDATELDGPQRRKMVDDIHEVVDSWGCPPLLVPWDPTANYGTGTDKWDNPQRHKMLAGFLYVGKHAETDYVLKIDTDAIATGMDDWIQPEWFADNPGIVAPPFSYTKPPSQMSELDCWAAKYGLFDTPPLNLVPEPGASLLRHPRIGGWCNFVRTDFLRQCAEMAEKTVGYGRLPEPSWDGFTWYAARRMNLPIRTVKMKRFGWDFKHTFGNIQEAAGRAMA